MRWAEVTGDYDYSYEAMKLINADIKVFDANHTHESIAPTLSWCRGELGALWVAMRSNRVPVEPTHLVRLKHLADAIIGLGVDGALCLCHGALGRLEFLAAAEAQCVLRDFEVTTWRRLLTAPSNSRLT